MASSRAATTANDDYHDHLRDDPHDPRVPVGGVRVSSDEERFGHGD